MEHRIFNLHSLTVRPIEVHLFVPPIVWKGDSVGHIGVNDAFFWVLEGQCFLSIDSQNYIVKPGQLAFLPKGKMRAYTHASKSFSMYEIAFEAKANGENLMEVLGLNSKNFVVDIKNKEEMSRLFENSSHKEFYKNPLYDVGWCANIINIIKMYTEEHQKHRGEDSITFKPVFEFMSTHIKDAIKIEDLAALVHMQPTYFIKRFRSEFGLPPLAYLNRMRIYTAMGKLAGTDDSIEQIASEIGIADTSYFARIFKKHCDVTPSEYRAEFKRNRLFLEKEV